MWNLDSEKMFRTSSTRYYASTGDCTKTVDFYVFGSQQFTVISDNLTSLTSLAARATNNLC